MSEKPYQLCVKMPILLDGLRHAFLIEVPGGGSAAEKAAQDAAATKAAQEKAAAKRAAAEKYAAKKAADRQAAAEKAAAEKAAAEKQAAREAEALIRRARDGRWEGNVYRPKAFDTRPPRRSEESGRGPRDTLH